MSSDSFNKPFTNVHTHTFTKEHTPKYIAKQVLPWPFYKWLGTGYAVNKIKGYLDRNKFDFTYAGRNKKHEAYRRKKFRTQTAFKIVYFLYLAVVWFIFSYYLLELILPWLDNTWLGWVFGKYIDWVSPIMPDLGNSWNSVLLLSFMILLFGTVRRALKNYIVNRIKKAVGKERLEFLLRYINIVRYAGRDRQATVFNDLEQQYPVGTKFVVLPMDMEYMGAGEVESPYPEQMNDLLTLKENNESTCYPFVFVDPRRIQEHGEVFLNLNTSNPDKIVLEDCQVKEYLDGGCCGIKIYPALGYYPFDKNLLALWLYCSQNDIPITTHCSIGPVFYRGKLIDLGKDYDVHPIFDEVYEKNNKTKEEIIGQLRFHELKNKEFQKNFTHPLNYLCLLHKPLLNKVVETFDKDGDLKTLFGYENGMIIRDLSQLKVNLAHYGSADMWDRFLSQDRYSEANAIIKDPKDGLDLKKNIERRSKRYQYWHYVDWFSIISTMMMQFDNLYTDISYTSHDLNYLALLSEILDNPKIAQRVLFGTDFYVVSNHKTEKQFWIDMQNTLGMEKWDLLANVNPTRFLKSKIVE